MHTHAHFRIVRSIYNNCNYYSTIEECNTYHIGIKKKNDDKVYLYISHISSIYIILYFLVKFKTRLNNLFNIIILPTVV